MRSRDHSKKLKITHAQPTLNEYRFPHDLTPLRQARETYVRVNLLRKRNILIKDHFETFQKKIMLI